MPGNMLILSHTSMYSVKDVLYIQCILHNHHDFLAFWDMQQSRNVNSFGVFE